MAKEQGTTVGKVAAGGKYLFTSYTKHLYNIYTMLDQRQRR